MPSRRIFLYTLLLLLFSISAGAQIVYKTPFGKKYHLVSCRMVEHTSSAISLDEAHNLGLAPCSICKPGTAPRTRASTLHGTPAGVAVGAQKATVQCRGNTKSGPRCRHRTSIADGFCYQHRPR